MNTVSEAIAHFKTLHYTYLNSVELQFIHMANGGDGTEAQEGEIRNTYYPTWTTNMFQEVCDKMGWDWQS